MTEAPSVCVCSKCGVSAPLHVARLKGWLVRERVGVPAGRWLVRCPAHASRRARAAVGLPERGSVLRVNRLIRRGLELQLDGVRFLAMLNTDSDMTEPYALLYRVGQPDHSSRLFFTLEQLCDAMALIADLRKWKATS